MCTAKSFVNLGVTQFESNDRKTAIEFFIKAADEDPTHDTAKQNLRVRFPAGWGMCLPAVSA